MEVNMSYFWKNDLVELRAITPDDSDTFYNLLFDTNTRRQANHGIYLPATESFAIDMTNFAANCFDEGDELWFAIMNDNEQMVGYVVVDWMNERMGNTQFCITIFEDFRRNHYASAAAKIVLEYLFNERRFHKVGCCIMENNHSAVSFIESLSFKLDGFRSEMFYTCGKYVGESYYSMLCDEYNNITTNKPDYDTINYLGYNIPNTSLGMSDKSIPKNEIPLLSDRPYFWEYDGICIREMTKEYNLINHEMILDTEACCFFDSDVKLPIISDELSEQEINHLDFGGDDDRLEFAITNSNGEYLGNINLCGIDKKNGKFSFSIYLTSNSRGFGFARKALRLLLCYAFYELRMHKMIACVNMGNHASASLIRSVGCHVEGVLRDNEYYHGKFVDVVLFGITKEEFEESNLIF